MADSGRKHLVWDIRKSLLALSGEELYQLTKTVGPVSGKEQSELEEGDQEGCFEYINAFMYSKQLLDSEDSGMVDLMMLKDAVDDVLTHRGAMLLNAMGNVESNTMQTDTYSFRPAHTIDINATQSNQIATEPTIGDTPKQITPAVVSSSPATTVSFSSALPSQSTDRLSASTLTFVPTSGVSSATMLNTSDTSNAELLKVLASYEDLSKKLIQCIPINATHSQGDLQPSSLSFSKPESEPPNSNPSAKSVTQPGREGMISMRELSFLQRSEFKVQGGQIGDQSADISYNNVCKQIEEGIKARFTEAEIVRGVLRIIKPGIFKDMLISKDDITLTELKGFLQTHLREKNSTELFQELMCAKQDENETPQQFLYRVMGLKQRILFTSKLSDTGIKYSAATVQDVFLHTVYQGFGNKHTDIRRVLKPLLSNSDVSDETILRHVMQIQSEESERQKRLGSSRRQTATNVHSAQLELNAVKGSSNKQESADHKTRSDPLKELAAKVDALTKMVEVMQQHTQPQPFYSEHRFNQNKAQSRRGKPFGCPKCVEQNRQDCQHCFICEEEGHRAAGCLKRQNKQGNFNRPL